MTSSPSPSAVIWAESPLQLLSAVEAQHAGLLGPDTEVVLRAGSDPLLATAVEVERLGPPDGLRPYSSRIPVARPPRSGHWVLGDAFSGAVQRRLLATGGHDLIIVDDGLATVHLLELLAAQSPRPLVRARARSNAARRALGLAARAKLIAAARAGRLTVFTAMPIARELRAGIEALGAQLISHDFTWLRGRPDEAPPVRRRLIVLGTSLVANGLVHRARYLEWVRSLAAIEPIAYRPHRRECPEVLAELREHPDVELASYGVPVEVSLRGLTADHHVLSLPSTALTSLRLVLRTSGTTIEGVTVPADWWTAAADAALRAHLSLFLGGLELAR